MANAIMAATSPKNHRLGFYFLQKNNPKINKTNDNDDGIISVRRRTAVAQK
jgi:hypothetical protein